MSPEHRARTRTPDVDHRGVASSSQVLERCLLLLTPLAIAVLELFHPNEFRAVFNDLAPIVDRWLWIHLLQLPLFGLLAGALLVLLRPHRGWMGFVGRLGVGLFAIFYLSMDAIAGVTTSLLIQNGQMLPPEQQAGVATVVQELFFDPLVGGSLSVFTVLGSLGYVLAVGTIGIARYRSGTPPTPVVLLVASSTFVVHPFPTGPLGMLLFFVAVAWMERLPPLVNLSGRSSTHHR